MGTVTGNGLRTGQGFATQGAALGRPWSGLQGTEGVLGLQYHSDKPLNYGPEEPLNDTTRQGYPAAARFGAPSGLYPPYGAGYAPASRMGNYGPWSDPRPRQSNYPYPAMPAGRYQPYGGYETTAQYEPPSAPYYPQPQYMEQYQRARQSLAAYYYMQLHEAGSAWSAGPMPGGYNGAHYAPGLAQPLQPNMMYMQSGLLPPEYRYSEFPMPREHGDLRPRVGQQRSDFLEDFKQKLTYGKKIELEDLKDHIVELAKDQYGSRHLQQKIQECTAAEKQQIFEEIKDQCIPLMSDLFGNYVVQMLMEKGEIEQRDKIIAKIQGTVPQLSFDMYGCRCVQKAIEVGTIEQKLLLLEEIKPRVADCVDNQHANHVLQKCIEKIPPEHIGFIFDYCTANVRSLNNP